MSAKLPDHITRLAAREVGVTENAGTNCGERVDQYKAATKLPPHEAWPWCAAFICWIVREAMLAAGIKETATFKRPTTAGAWPLEQWSLDQDQSTWTRRLPKADIEPGDIIIFTFSHCGIAISGPDDNGYIRTIEGNTDALGSREGGGVFRKIRPLSKIRSRIRFRI